MTYIQNVCLGSLSHYQLSLI